MGPDCRGNLERSSRYVIESVAAPHCLCSSVAPPASLHRTLPSATGLCYPQPNLAVSLYYRCLFLHSIQPFSLSQSSQNISRLNSRHVQRAVRRNLKDERSDGASYSISLRVAWVMSNEYTLKRRRPYRNHHGSEDSENDGIPGWSTKLLAIPDF